MNTSFEINLKLKMPTSEPTAGLLTAKERVEKLHLAPYSLIPCVKTYTN